MAGGKAYNQATNDDVRIYMKMMIHQCIVVSFLLLGCDVEWIFVVMIVTLIGNRDKKNRLKVGNDRDKKGPGCAHFSRRQLHGRTVEVRR